jgi:hypothetical protein
VGSGNVPFMIGCHDAVTARPNARRNFAPERLGTGGWQMLAWLFEIIRRIGYRPERRYMRGGQPRA